MGHTANREFLAEAWLSLESSVRYQAEEELALVYVASGKRAVGHKLQGANQTEGYKGKG